MFDNPRKELLKLQRELLAEEEEVDPEEAFYEMKEFLDQEDGEYREPLEIRYSREPWQEEDWESQELPEAKPQRNRKTGGLITAIVLEILALLGLLAWWLLW